MKKSIMLACVSMAVLSFGGTMSLANDERLKNCRTKVTAGSDAFCSGYLMGYKDAEDALAGILPGTQSWKELLERYPGLVSPSSTAGYEQPPVFLIDKNTQVLYQAVGDTSKVIGTVEMDAFVKPDSMSPMALTPTE